MNRALGIGLVVVSLAWGEFTPITAAATNLSEASLEELMEVRVTTVSRGESTIGQSPAAIFVVTPEMIRRSGATSIPEILRMVRLAWKPRENLELALVAQNLLDNHHPELGTSPLVRSPLVEVERSVHGKVTVQW